MNMNKRKVLSAIALFALIAGAFIFIGSYEINDADQVTVDGWTYDVNGNTITISAVGNTDLDLSEIGSISTIVWDIANSNGYSISNGINKVLISENVF